MSAQKIHSETGLPIFDDGRTLAYGGRGSGHLRIPEHDKTMLRRVHLWGDYFSGKFLRHALEKADEMLQDAASYCQASVPTHTWGLVPLDICRSLIFLNTHTDYSIPEGYILAADVEVVDNVVYPWQDGSDTALYNNLRAYRILSNHEALWRDSKIEQFATGKGRLSSYAGRWLLDIEPCADYNWRR